MAYGAFMYVYIRMYIYLFMNKKCIYMYVFTMFSVLAISTKIRIIESRLDDFEGRMKVTSEVSRVYPMALYTGFYSFQRIIILNFDHTTNVDSKRMNGRLKERGLSVFAIEDFFFREIT